MSGQYDDNVLVRNLIILPFINLITFNILDDDNLRWVIFSYQNTSLDYTLICFQIQRCQKFMYSL